MRIWGKSARIGEHALRRLRMSSISVGRRRPAVLVMLSLLSAVVLLGSAEAKRPPTKPRTPWIYVLHVKYMGEGHLLVTSAKYGVVAERDGHTTWWGETGPFTLTNTGTRSKPILSVTPPSGRSWKTWVTAYDEVGLPMDHSGKGGTGVRGICWGDTVEKLESGTAKAHLTLRRNRLRVQLLGSGHVTVTATGCKGDVTTYDCPQCLDLEPSDNPDWRAWWGKFKLSRAVLARFKLGRPFYVTVIRDPNNDPSLMHPVHVGDSSGERFERYTWELSFYPRRPVR